MLSALQASSPHLTRYLCAAAVIHKKKKNYLKDVARVIGQANRASIAILLSWRV